MADGVVQVAPDSTGKFIDNEELLVAGVLVERQRVRPAGGAAGELLDVRNAAPGANDYGAVVRAGDGHIVTLGKTNDAAAASDVDNVGLIALFKRLLGRLTTLITDMATGVKQDTGNVSLASIDAKLSGALSVTGSTVGIVGSVEVVNDVGNPLPVSGTVALSNAFNLEATQLLVKAKTDNLDVALSTRLKPADTLTAVATVTNLAQLGGQAVTMGSGARTAGTLRVTVATDDVVPVTNANLDVALSTIATSARQDTGNASLASIDSKTGTVADKPAAFTELDRLYQLGVKLDKLTASIATEATLRQLLAAKPAAKPTSTLLHRS